MAKKTKLPPLEGVPDKEPLRDIVDLPPLRRDAPVTHARVRIMLDAKGKSKVEKLHFVERPVDTRTAIAGDWIFDIHDANGRIGAMSMIDPFETRGAGRPHMDDHSYGRAKTATINLDIPVVHPAILDELRVKVVRLRAPFADIAAAIAAIDTRQDMVQAKGAPQSPFDLEPIELMEEIDIGRALRPSKPPGKSKAPRKANEVG